MKKLRCYGKAIAGTYWWHVVCPVHGVISQSVHGSFALMTMNSHIRWMHPDGGKGL